MKIGRRWSDTHTNWREKALVEVLTNLFSSKGTDTV